MAWFLLIVAAFIAALAFLVCMMALALLAFSTWLYSIS